ncbi:hypothetical protein [Sphingomonas sp. BAUL-RG-20F-R05-02]|uniref:hypothetical protein n=1 Tax=Sphingomonas sp. BAUL-RG-20F-R05-02 TaxID=2914830 RepID=UPI001F561EE0|nr:hypothetical protein [Sphingomonas sp. BAUL-RG-20F-R05-02]
MSNANNNLVSTSLSNNTNLDLDVTNEAEFKKLYEGFRNSVMAIGKGYSAEAKKLSTRKRDALYVDLGAAAAVAEVMLDPMNVDYLIDALDFHGIPAVMDPDKGNVFVPICRLLWGHWPKATKGNPDPAFTWDRSPELYGKVLRGARVLGVKPADLAAQLSKEKGFKKFKEADDKRYLKDDLDEKVKKERFEKVISDDPKAVFPSEGFNIPTKDRPSLVAVLCAVSDDGLELRALQKLDISVQTLEQQVHKMAPTLVGGILLRQAERKANDAEARALAAEAALAQSITDVAVDVAAGVARWNDDNAAS